MSGGCDTEWSDLDRARVIIANLTKERDTLKEKVEALMRERNTLRTDVDRYFERMVRLEGERDRAEKDDGEVK
jgi:regulator of replication initiation timing